MEGLAGQETRRGFYVLRWLFIEFYIGFGNQYLMNGFVLLRLRDRASDVVSVS